MSRVRASLTLIAALACNYRMVSAQNLSADPTAISFAATADTPLQPGLFQVVGIGASAPVPIKYFGSKNDAVASGPDFFIASPSIGTAPLEIGIALNPNVVPYLQPGVYQQSLYFGPSDQPFPEHPLFVVSLFLKTPGLPSIASVVTDAAKNSVQNGPTHPAPAGSIVTLFATGAGLWNVPFPDGGVVLTLQGTFGNVVVNKIVPMASVSMTIGGQAAKIAYAGAAPTLAFGTLQVNAIVPDGIGSGPQPVVLKVGLTDNSQQKVTMYVQ